MINYVFAAEFDILKGCVIKNYYPQKLIQFNDALLSTYMVPDGSHRVIHIFYPILMVFIYII